MAMATTTTAVRSYRSCKHQRRHCLCRHHGLANVRKTAKATTRTTPGGANGNIGGKGKSGKGGKARSSTKAKTVAGYRQYERGTGGASWVRRRKPPMRLVGSWRWRGGAGGVGEWGKR